MTRMFSVKRTLNHFNPWHVVTYTQRCYSNFGRLITILITQNFLSKGLGRQIIELSALPYYDNQGYSSEQYQLNKTIASLPQSLKGMMGSISDTLPLFGFQKTYYMVITSIVSLVAAITITFLPYNTNAEYFAELPAIIFLLINLMITWHELLCQGKFVEKLREKPETRSDVVTIVWLYSIIGGIIPAASVGYLADNIDVRYLYIYLIPMSIVPIIVLSFGCMVDDRVNKEMNNRFNIKLIKAQWTVLGLSFLVGFSALISMFVGILGNNLVKFVYSLVSSTILSILCFMVLPSIVARASLYMYFAGAAYLDITGVLDFFYTAEPICLANGPHFDYTYYRTYTAVVGMIAELFGLYIFQTQLIRYRLRSIYWFATSLQFVACFFDIVIINRWNTLIHIPDKFMYMLGNAIIYKVVYQLEFMPNNFLIAKLCPKNVEATVYALVAGFSNYGVYLSSYMGLYITEFFGVYATAIDSADCNFNNLAWLVFISHGFLPALFSIPVIPLLLPNIYFAETTTGYNSKFETKIVKQTEA